MQRKRPLYRLICILAEGVCRLFFRAKTRFLSATYPHKGGIVIASNHVSHLDPPLIAASWPWEIHFLAADYLFTIPILGRLIRRLNSHPVHRGSGDLSAFKTAVRLLQEGSTLLIFPEGRRSENLKLQPFKQGVAMLCQKTGCPAVPTYIAGAGEVWPRDRRFPRLFGRINIFFGAPLYFDPDPTLDKRVAQEQFTQQLYEAIEGLREQFEQQKKG